MRTHNNSKEYIVIFSFIIKLDIIANFQLLRPIYFLLELTVLFLSFPGFCLYHCWSLLYRCYLWRLIFPLYLFSQILLVNSYVYTEITIFSSSSKKLAMPINAYSLQPTWETSFYLLSNSQLCMSSNFVVFVFTLRKNRSNTPIAIAQLPYYSIFNLKFHCMQVSY